MGAGTALRLTHTAVFTAVCVLASGLGHALSAGSPPAFWQLLLLSPLLWAVGWWLSRARRAASTVAAVTGVLQLALHLFLGLLAGPRCGPRPPLSATGPETATAHAAAAASRTAPAPAPLSGAGSASRGPSAGDMPLGRTELPRARADALSDTAWPGSLAPDTTGLVPDMAMGGAHVLAGLLCGWWLWRGQRALEQVLTALRMALAPRLPADLLHRVRTALPHPCPRVPLPAAPPRLPPLRRGVLRARPRRGPPVPTC